MAVIVMYQEDLTMSDKTYTERQEAEMELESALLEFKNKAIADDLSNDEMLEAITDRMVEAGFDKFDILNTDT
jgi:hypothetical protein